MSATGSENPVTLMVTDKAESSDHLTLTCELC